MNDFDNEESNNAVANQSSDQDQAALSESMTPSELLSDGLMCLILPKIRKFCEKLEEVTKNQDVMIESLKKENDKVKEWNVNDEVSAYMNEVKHYHTKLLKLQKDMKQVKEKTVKFKERSVKLKILKQKEESKQRELKRKKEEEDLKLIAKPVTNTE